MKLNDTNYEVENQFDEESKDFEITNSAKMFDILSSKLYADPIRAILREISCNAIDANIDAGTNDPIKVYLPTSEFPSLIIKDSGIGMTHEDVMTVYSSYGKSTKAQSNKLIGALGLGGKTPLAYTGQFTLTTSKDGEENSYIIFKDEHGIPKITRMNSKPSDASGTSVEILVKEEDIDSFYFAAQKTFFFFDKTPFIARGEEHYYDIFRHKCLRGYEFKTANINEIKVEYERSRNLLKDDIIIFRDHANENALNQFMNSFDSKYGVIMGQVYYSINETLLFDDPRFITSESAKQALAFPAIRNSYMKKILRVKIGDVSPQPSREVLNYNKQTVAFLQKKLYASYTTFYNQVTSYKTPTGLIKHIHTIPHFNLIDNSMLEQKSDTTKLRDTFISVSNYFFNKVKQKDGLLIRAKKRNSYDSKSCWDMLDLSASNISHSRLEDTFKMIIDKRLDAVICIDDFKLEKTIKEFLKKGSYENKTAPLALKNKINIAKIDSDKSVLVCTRLECEEISKIIDISIIHSDKLIVPKTPKQQIAKERSARNIEGKCWDFFGNNYVDVSQVLKEKNVSYELFEGEPRKRGWWFTPKFNELASGKKMSKKDSIIIDDKGIEVYNNYKISKITELYNTIYKDVPHAKHYLIDWTFFKKNNIQTNKNWIWVNDYITNFVNKEFKTVKDFFSNYVIHGKSIFNDEKKAEVYLKSLSKYNNWQDSEFGKECLRKINESKMIETNIAYKNSIYYKLIELYTGSKWKDEYAKIKEVINNSPPKIDYIKNLHDVYPMLKIVDVNHHDKVDIISDYVALVDGLK